MHFGFFKNEIYIPEYFCLMHKYYDDFFFMGLCSPFRLYLQSIQKINSNLLRMHIFYEKTQNKVERVLNIIAQFRISQKWKIMKQNKLSKTIQTFGGNTGSSRKNQCEFTNWNTESWRSKKIHLGTSGTCRKVKWAN